MAPLLPFNTISNNKIISDWIFESVFYAILIVSIADRAKKKLNNGTDVRTKKKNDRTTQL